MTQFLLIIVFVLALASQPLQGDGWFWEIGNAIGFVALAALFILISNGRVGNGSSRQHRWLGIASLVLILVHCAWFLIGDSVSIEYLKWDAPNYMVLGILATGLAMIVTISSLARVRKSHYSNHNKFRVWHRWLSVIVLAASILHVGLSGLYITTKLQWALLGVLFCLAYVISRWLSEKGFASMIRPTLLTISSIIVAALFVLARNWSLI